MVGQAKLYCETRQEEMCVQTFQESYIRDAGPSSTKYANGKGSYHISSYEAISWESLTAPFQVEAGESLQSTADASELRRESSAERGRKGAPSKCTDMLVASQQKPRPSRSTKSEATRSTVADSLKR